MADCLRFCSTSFAVTDILADSEAQSATMTTDAADGFAISVSVRNTGAVRGAKTVMAFISQSGGDSDGPRDSLWSLRKVSLAPQESQLLEFRAAEVDWCPFCTVSVDGVRAVRAGEYTVRIGGDGGNGGACGGVASSDECAVRRVVLSGPEIPRPL